MSNPKGVDFDEVQSGNWNVAKPYTTEKILKWLVLIDDYQTIATFGYSNIESDVFIRDNNLKNTSRIQAMRRLIHAIISLIRNTKFAVRKKDNQFDSYSKRLLVIEKHINSLKVEQKRGSRVMELNINEPLFDSMMEEISEMIDNINTKLNESDLIFTHTEEYDPKKIKDALKDKYINRG